MCWRIVVQHPPTFCWAPKYQKLVKDGVVVGFVEVSICPDCGEEYITNIFSDGDIDLECLATELGFREDFEDDADDDDELFMD